MFRKTIIYQNNDELMINNFEGMLKTGDLSNMFHFENLLGNKVKRKKLFGKKKFYKRLQDAWFSCYNEYLRTFGLNKHYLRMLELEDKIALMKIKMHTTSSKHLSSKVNILEMELEGMQSPKSKQRSFEDDLITIEKYQGVSVKGDTTSATRFFTYAKRMSEEAQEIRAEQRKKTMGNAG